MAGFLFEWRAALMAKDSPLTATERHVALTLSAHMSVDGDSCYPSMRLLARECARSTSTVVVAVETIAAHGFIEVARGGGRRSNRYRAVVPEICRAQRDIGGTVPTIYVALSARQRRDLGAVVSRSPRPRFSGGSMDPPKQRRAQRDKTENRDSSCPECGDKPWTCHRCARYVNDPST